MTEDLERSATVHFKQENGDIPDISVESELSRLTQEGPAEFSVTYSQSQMESWQFHTHTRLRGQSSSFKMSQDGAKQVFAYFTDKGVQTPDHHSNPKTGETEFYLSDENIQHLRQDAFEVVGTDFDILKYRDEEELREKSRKESRWDDISRRFLESYEGCFNSETPSVSNVGDQIKRGVLSHEYTHLSQKLDLEVDDNNNPLNIKDRIKKVMSLVSDGLIQVDSPDFKKLMMRVRRYRVFTEAHAMTEEMIAWSSDQQTTSNQSVMLLRYGEVLADLRDALSIEEIYKQESEININEYHIAALMILANTTEWPIRDIGGDGYQELERQVLEGVALIIDDPDEFVSSRKGLQEKLEDLIRNEAKSFVELMDGLENSASPASSKKRQRLI